MRLFLVAIVSFLCFGNLAAQSDNSRLLVEGLVMNTSYRTLPDAKVLVLSKNDTLATIAPNSKGVFRYLFRSEGQYKMVFQQKGYQDFTLIINTKGMSGEFDYDLTGMMIKLPKQGQESRGSAIVTEAEIFYEASFDSFVFKSEVGG
ncbi:MAG: hypothetical protein ACFB10_08085 [Salibacteraceae bacterium]